MKDQLRVPYAQAVYGKKEVQAVIRALKNPLKIVAGPLVRKFENRIARLFGQQYGVMVNSGSSANLLAIELLDLAPGSEVITPVLTFGTTLAPMVQKGLVPVFVDVKPRTYVIDVNRIEALISKKTKAMMIPSLIGNLPDWVRLRKIAKKYKLWLIEDSCDTLSPRFAGKPTGFYSDITTTSFAASHIMTTAGSGGMICVHNETLARRARLKSNWGRASTLFGFYEHSEEIKKRFSGKLAGDAYDAKFIFSEIGYNFQATELQAAFGLEQLKRLSFASRRRAKNFKALNEFFKKYDGFFLLPKQDPRTRTNWLAFPLTIKPGAPFTRFALTKYLEEHNIQTRPIFTGNVLRQPAFQHIRCRRESDGYSVADYIMKNSFLIGCHHGLGTQHIAYIKRTFNEFLKQYA